MVVRQRRVSKSQARRSSFNKSESAKESRPKADSPKSTDWNFFRSRRFVFILGAVLGVGMAWYTAKTQDFVSLEALNELVSMDYLADISLDNIMGDFRDMLPSGIVKEARDIESHHAILSESFAIGNHLRLTEGLKAKHPVVLIPGVISTGLESWSVEGTTECPSQPYFRKRLWGSWYMLRSMLLDKTCWLKHIMLDPETGLDPPGFKLRAAQGMEAADFFVPGYWIWNKIIENLSAIGYDINTMTIASYDWRLSYPDLEIRDRYFSNLKRTIEENLEKTGEKSVLVGHSMGSQVLFYFMKWVEAEGHGNGGKSWVNDHIHAFVDIAGSILGTPKAIVALLSGEMKDTVQLNALAVYGLEKFFSRRERAGMLRTFGGVASMFPKGGDTIWGDLFGAPDDTPLRDVTGLSFGNFIRFRNPLSELSSKNLTISDSIEYVYNQAPEWFRERTEKAYSHGVAKTRTEVVQNEKNASKWINPLEVALPYAPDMHIYSFYGVGKPTERSYYYQEELDKNILHLKVTIAPNDPDAVVLGEGDGTISILTHSMSFRWKDKDSKFNPANIPVTVVEMVHQPDRLDIRGGAKTGDHVDILGRTELNELLLRVAAGLGDQIEEKVSSNILDFVSKFDLGEN